MNSSHPNSPALLPGSIHRRVAAYAIDIGIAVAIALMVVAMLSGAAFGLGGLLGTTAAPAERVAPILLLASCAGWTAACIAMQHRGGSFGQRLMGSRGAKPVTPASASAFAAEPSTEYGAPVNRAPVLAVLMWDDGSPMAVYERTVCGRNPAQEDGAVARALRDETLSLSKTHFEIGGDPAGAWIIDRFSTNGTHLVRDGERVGLAAGLPTMLRVGDRLEFGDRSAVVGVPS